MRQIVWGVSLLLLCAVGGLGQPAEDRPPEAASDAAPEIGVGVGLRAPDFYLPVVGSEPLAKVHLTDYVGRYDVVMLYFFSAAS